MRNAMKREKEIATGASLASVETKHTASPMAPAHHCILFFLVTLELFFLF